jgi:hypothetical protein
VLWTLFRRFFRPKELIATTLVSVSEEGQFRVHNDISRSILSP